MHRWEEYKKSYPPENWLISEPEWDRDMQKVRETQFTQGNGYFCCRPQPPYEEMRSGQTAESGSDDQRRCRHGSIVPPLHTPLPGVRPQSAAH